MGHFACKIDIKESLTRFARGSETSSEQCTLNIGEGKIMEFFRQNQKVIIIVIAVTFIGFTIAPVIMSMLTMK